MLKDFEQYLIQKGYRQFTDSDNPSTVYDYLKRINKICEREHLTIIELEKNIDSILSKYDRGGSEEYFGLKSHSSYINALRRFKRDCARSGVLQEVRKREHYEKPSVKRKKKSEAARKRKY